MSYKLRFHEQALKEWKKLGATLQEQFKKKLAERLEQPRIPSAALSGMPDCYKIKLKAAGYRLVYRVEDDIVLCYRNRCWKTRAQRRIRYCAQSYVR